MHGAGSPFDHPARERSAGGEVGVRPGFPPSFGHIGESRSLLLTRVIGNSGAQPYPGRERRSLRLQDDPRIMRSSSETHVAFDFRMFGSASLNCGAVRIACARRHECGYGCTKIKGKFPIV